MINLQTPSLLAQEINFPGLGASGNAGNAGGTLAKFASTILGTLTLIAGLAFAIYFVLGAIKWITSGGDPAKVQSARDRITSAIIGMAVLFSVVAVSALVDNVFGTNILNLNIARNI